MKTITPSRVLLIVLAALALGGCATSKPYQDDQEYSDIPWNTPQQWEGSRSIPGMGGGGY